MQSNCSNAFLFILYSILHRHWLTNSYIYFGIPYFPYDMWAMYAYNLRLHEHIYLKKHPLKRFKTFVKHNQLMIIHHVVLPLILFPVVVVI